MVRRSCDPACRTAHASNLCCCCAPVQWQDPAFMCAKIAGLRCRYELQLDTSRNGPVCTGNRGFHLAFVLAFSIQILRSCTVRAFRARVVNARYHGSSPCSCSDLATGCAGEPMMLNAYVWQYGCVEAGTASGSFCVPRHGFITACLPANSSSKPSQTHVLTSDHLCLQFDSQTLLLAYKQTFGGRMPPLWFGDTLCVRSGPSSANSRVSQAQPGARLVSSCGTASLQNWPSGASVPRPGSQVSRLTQMEPRLELHRTRLGATSCYTASRVQNMTWQWQPHAWKE